MTENPYRCVNCSKFLMEDESNVCADCIADAEGDKE